MGFEHHTFFKQRSQTISMYRSPLYRTYTTFISYLKNTSSVFFSLFPQAIQMIILIVIFTFTDWTIMDTGLTKLDKLLLQMWMEQETVFVTQEKL